MLKLRVSGNMPLGSLGITRPVILKVTGRRDYPEPLRSRACLLVNAAPDDLPSGFSVVLSRNSAATVKPTATNVISIGPDLDYLADGDVIKIAPEASVTVIYRRRAHANALLVTERCNSYCVMCSQPPRDINDDHLIEDYLEAIPLMDRSAREIGITGGEPTLLGGRLFALLNALKSYLPETAVHVLTNGRNCKDFWLCKQFAAVRHQDLMLGIPLYSDVPAIHDFVVQARGAYDETIRGILNLKRCNVKVELRVVIHRYTYERLPQLARFITRNLQFVDHVALMGLELMGFAKSNLNAIWIDPVEYQAQLKDAVTTLEMGRVRTSIYNHQLCLLDRSLWKFAVKSISDWKNEYLPECDTCEVKSDCGGFFSSAKLRYSPNVRAQRGTPLSAVS